MLRHCRVCARQLELLAAPPVASTSKSHSFAKPGPSKKARQHTKRSFSRSATSLFGHAPPEATVRIGERSHEQEYQPGPGTSLWKGKARAIEAPVVEEVPYDPEHSQRPHTTLLDNEERDATAEDTVSSYDAETSDSAFMSGTISCSRSRRPRAAAALLRIMSSITDPPEGPPQLAEIKRDVLAFGEEHASELQDADLRSIEDIDWSVTTLDSLLHPLASLHLAFSTNQSMSASRLQYRRWLESAMRYLSGRTDQQALLLVASVSAFAERGQDDAVIAMARHAHTLFGAWVPEILTMYLEALIAVDKPHLAPNLEALPAGLSLETFNLLLVAHLQARDLLAARQIFSALRERGLQPDRTTYMAVLRGYRALGANHNLYRALVGTIRELHLPHNTETINIFIECCLAIGDLEGAYELFKQFEPPPMLPAPASSARSLPQVADPPREQLLPMPKDPPPANIGQTQLADGHGASPLDLAKSSPRGEELATMSQLKPNEATLALFVEGHIASGRLEEALDTMARMLDDGLRPSPFLVRAIRMAYLRQDQSPDQRANSALLEHVLAQNYDLRADADQPVEEMRRKISQYHFQLKQALDTSGLKTIPSIIDDMTDEGIAVRSKALTWIVAYVARRVSFTKIEAVVSGLRGGSSSESFPALSEFNLMLDALIREDDAQYVLRGLNETMKEEIIPGASDMPSEAQPRQERFTAVVEWLREATLLPDAYTCAILMRRFAKSGGSPRALWSFFQRQVLNRGLQPSPHHIVPLMVAYSKAGDPYGARRAMDRGSALGVEPNVNHYTVLLSHYAHAKKPELVRTLFQEMQDRGIQADRKAYVILAHAAASNALVQQVLAIMRQYRKLLPDAPWPESGLISCLFNVRNRRREFRVAQYVVRDALDKGLIPDAMLQRAVWRNLKDHKENTRKLQARGIESVHRVEAADLADANFKRMRQLSQRAAKQEQSERDLEADLIATLEAIARNRTISEGLGSADDSQSVNEGLE